MMWDVCEHHVRHHEMISHKGMNWTGNSVIVGAVLQQHALCPHYISSWYSVGWYTRLLHKSLATTGLTCQHRFADCFITTLFQFKSRLIHSNQQFQHRLVVPLMD
jgi:hypothetical protein